MNWSDVLAVITGVVLPILFTVALYYLAKLVKSKMKAEDLALIVSLADIAVNAVEKIAQSKGWKGAEKYIHAVEYFKKLLEEKNLDVPENIWRPIIEASVNQLP